MWGKRATGSFQFHTLIIILTLECCINGALGDWRYKSRPDLSPPRLNITTASKGKVAPGYLFITPHADNASTRLKSQGPLQPAPYIFSTTGELVWSGFGYFGQWTGNFQAGKYNGEGILFAYEGSQSPGSGHETGHIKILDSHYDTLKEVRGGNHALLGVDEFQIVDEKSALVVTHPPTPFGLKAYGLGPKSQWILDSRFQEIELDTGRLLFEWKSLDHISPDESIEPISSLSFGAGYNSTDAIDYFHINSVDLDKAHNYLISASHASTIYKINGTSGEIIWRLGGKHSNFTFGDGAEFSVPAHARFVVNSTDENIEVISFFDSAKLFKFNGHVSSHQSSGKIVSLDTKTWTATLLQAFHSPDNISIGSEGSIQILPNSNTLVNWESPASISEFSTDGSLIFHTYLDSGDLWSNSSIYSYRGFKFNWAAIPHEDPAIVALEHGESTMVYVSWNGDTETDIWRFYGIDGDGERVTLGDEKRLGFETGFYVRSGGDWEAFFAKAIGAGGEELKSSRVVKAEEYIYEYVPGRDDLTFGDGRDQAIVGVGGGEL